MYPASISPVAHYPLFDVAAPPQRLGGAVVNTRYTTQLFIRSVPPPPNSSSYTCRSAMKPCELVLSSQLELGVRSSKSSPHLRNFFRGSGKCAPPGGMAQTVRLAASLKGKASRGRCRLDVQQSGTNPDSHTDWPPEGNAYKIVGVVRELVTGIHQIQFKVEIQSARRLEIESERFRCSQIDATPGGSLMATAKGRFVSVQWPGNDDGMVRELKVGQRVSFKGYCTVHHSYGFLLKVPQSTKSIKEKGVQLLGKKKTKGVERAETVQASSIDEVSDVDFKTLNQPPPSLPSDKALMKRWERCPGVGQVTAAGIVRCLGSERAEEILTSSIELSNRGSVYDDLMKCPEIGDGKASKIMKFLE